MYNSNSCYNFLCKLIQHIYDEPTEPKTHPVSEEERKEHKLLIYRQRLVFVETIGVKHFCEFADQDYQKVKAEMKKEINKKIKELL